MSDVRQYLQWLMVLIALVIGAPALAQPVVSVTVIDGVAEEADAANTATIRFSRSDTTGQLRIETDFEPTTTAIGGTDWTDNNNGFFRSFGQVTIPDGAAEFDLIITAIADNLVEDEERADFTIVADAAYTIGASASASFTITDDPAIVNVTATDASATEGADTAVFQFTRSGGNLAASLRVDVTFEPTTTAIGGTDWTDNNNGFFRSFGQATIPAGEASFDLVVTAVADNLVEGDELIDITLDPSSTYDRGAMDSAAITVVDDAATVIVEAVDAIATEGGVDTAVFRFTRDGGNLAASLQVNVTFEPTTTAIGGTDWTDNNNGFFRSFGRATIPANELTFDLVISATADTLDEGNEFIDITLDAGDYLIGVPDRAGITVLDDLLFSDGFEGSAQIAKSACDIAAAAKTDGGRFFDAGPAIVDLDTNLTWLRCAITEFFDWASDGCLTDVDAFDIRADLDDLNAGVIGDNASFDDWRTPTEREISTVGAAASGCLIRD